MRNLRFSTLLFRQIILRAARSSQAQTETASFDSIGALGIRILQDSPPLLWITQPIY